MDRYDGPLFDCDNHYYEAADAFTRHVPRADQEKLLYRNTAALNERRAA